MALDNKYITISGQPTFEQQKISFPSSEFGVNINAFLSAFNAQFGFNTAPHRFELEYVPDDFTYSILPTIGTAVSFTINERFYIAGKIVHADWTATDRGKILNISIEDNRLDLDDVTLDTFGMFGSSDAVITNIVDVRYWYMNTYVKTRSAGRNILIKDLSMLDQHGASYRQIYEAIKYFEQTLGTISNIIDKIPRPEIIEKQLSGDPEAFRWHFRAQPLLQCIARVLNDVSYDFYWNMQNDEINVINRKYAINIDANNIPVAGDPNEIISKRYGKDEGEDPTVVKVLGAEMEGIIGYGNEGGAFGLTSAEYDLGLGSVSDMIFVPAWRNAKLQYFGPGGSLREHTPTDRELSLALKGIEYWATVIPGLDNRITNSTFNSTTTSSIYGITVKQSNLTSNVSRLGLIPNRGQLDRGWVIEFYNRVRTFAQNYYGRAYYLSPRSSLYSKLDEIEVMPAAWCNLENLSQDGVFTDDYKVDRLYRKYAPFWDADANKLKAFAVLKWNTKWGEDGKGHPAQFTNWTEMDGYQYVPIEVKKWDSLRKKFDEDYLEPMSRYEKGIMIRLPNIAWTTYHKVDPQLGAVPFLLEVRKRFNSETRRDFEDPIIKPEPYSSLSGVIGLPVRVKRRYGYKYPSIWSSGTGTKVELNINDDYAPWSYEPRGNKTSVDLLDDDINAILYSRIVNRDEVTFAEVQRVGLPYISFDSFSNQNLTEQGYGIVSHGITSINVSESVGGWWQTRYNVKSHFPDFVKIRPVVEGAEEDFNFVLHRALGKLQRLPPEVESFSTAPIMEPDTNFGGEFPNEQLDKLEIPVVIAEVYDRGSNEYYLGIDEHNIKWPRALDSIYNSASFTNQARVAHCVDGFLQVGMNAVYHYEEQPDGTFVHYFTGGFPLTAGRVVEITSSPELVNQIWVANCRTLPTEVESPLGGTQIVEPFEFFDVPFMFQQAVDTSIKSGDKMMIASHGNKNGLTPDGDYGPGGNNDGDAYLANNSVPSDTFIGYVLTRPNTDTGRGGAVVTIDAAGGTTYSDGADVGDSTYYVYFVGAELYNIAEGDYCIIKRERENDQDNAFRLYCLIQKPSFSGTDAFGG